MSEIRLVIGNRNYSSWSLRGWLAVKLSGLPFTEERLPIGTPAFASGIAAWSPARLVPILAVDDLVVWDSLAIAETLAELAPEAPLWPAERRARATARSLCAEMHSGFPALREHMPMNIRARYPGVGREPGVSSEIERVIALWGHARHHFGAEGRFLFGSYSLADAFYAPVAFRMQTYGVALPEFAERYVAALLEHEDVAAWARAAQAESEVIDRYERGR